MKENKPRQQKKDPTQPFVGTYRLGLTNVDIYGISGTGGGQFFCAPDNVSLPRIKIGLSYDHWWEVVMVLMHESFEYLCVAHQCRFVPCGSNPNASDVYQFVFDHNQMTQIIDDQAYFLSKCLPDLADVYGKFKKQRK